MLGDDRALMRTTQSFPAMRGVIARIRKVFSATNPQAFEKMEGDSQETNRFMFPKTRKLVRTNELKLGMQSQKPQDPSTNAQLMSSTPFRASMQEVVGFDQDSTSSTGHGCNSNSVKLNNDSPDPSTPRNLNSAPYGQGFEEPGPSNRPPQGEENLESHALSISERVIGLRPPGSGGGSFDLFTTQDADSISQGNTVLNTGCTERTERVERSTPAGHVLPDPALQHLQRVIAQNSSPLSIGPLTDSEWPFYKNFNGNWLFDRVRSDDIGPSINILEIRRNTSSRDSNNMKLYLDDKHVKISMTMNGLGVIDEDRPWTGSVVPSTRRDRRRGGAECWIERFPRGLLLRTRWSGYLAANVFEYLELSPDFMQLIVRQDIVRETGEFCQTKSIWQRRL